jgi:hypothetical protein
MPVATHGHFASFVSIIHHLRIHPKEIFWYKYHLKCYVCIANWQFGAHILHAKCSMPITSWSKLKKGARSGVNNNITAQELV